MLKNIFSQSFLAENNKSIDELITLGEKSDPMILPNLKLSFDPQFSTSLNVPFIEEQRKPGRSMRTRTKPILMSSNSRYPLSGGINSAKTFKPLFFVLPKYAYHNSGTFLQYSAPQREILGTKFELGLIDENNHSQISNSADTNSPLLMNLKEETIGSNHQLIKDGLPPIPRSRDQDKLLS